MQKTQYNILHYKAPKQVLWALFIGVHTIRMSKCNKIGPINLGDFSSIPKCFIGPAHFFIQFRLIVDIFINLYLVRIIWTVHTLKLWKCIHASIWPSIINIFEYQAPMVSYPNPTGSHVLNDACECLEWHRGTHCSEWHVECERICL